MNLLTMEINRRYLNVDLSAARPVLAISANPGGLFLSIFLPSFLSRTQLCAYDFRFRDLHIHGPIIHHIEIKGAVKSDIWRHVPQQVMYMYSKFMDLFYLTPKQGAATSLYAALADDRYIFDDMDRLIVNNRSFETGGFTKLPTSLSSPGGKWCTHMNLPYLIPYKLPFQALAFEMLGGYDSFQKISFFCLFYNDVTSVSNRCSS